MAFQDLPFLPFTMQGRSRDSRQFPSHEEVLPSTNAVVGWLEWATRTHLPHPLLRDGTGIAMNASV